MDVVPYRLLVDGIGLDWIYLGGALYRLTVQTNKRKNYETKNYKTIYFRSYLK